jgi:hypothetical protein
MKKLLTELEKEKHPSAAPSITRRPPERKGSSQTMGSSQPEFGDDDHPAQTSHRDSQPHYM